MIGDLRSIVAADVRRVDWAVIRWCQPPEGWCKLNNNRAVVAGSGDSAGGGVIQNASGHWLIGFNRWLVDNVEVFNLLQYYNEGSLTLSLVSHIVSMVNRQWSVEICHILREGNKLVDCMSKCASREVLICHHFFPPKVVKLQLEEDLRNTSIERG
ncbi:hypothetical protein V6N12_058818 [Hibiscus sabdariffa]|uniref:RNase H type-1 domain-containing protein n=1 Tax=Hibiscus sabdariffa TaxID=183260 RepID=A0ABR2EV31_9ROSI